METHRDIIRQRGGIRGLARELGHRNHTTVQGWFERDNIPEDRMPSVMAVQPKGQDAAA
jgi:hypothetical protein